LLWLAKSVECLPKSGDGLLAFDAGHQLGLEFKPEMRGVRPDRVSIRLREFDD